MGKLRIPKRMVRKREMVRGFVCPSPVSDYLFFRYGKNWETPKKGKSGWGSDVGEALVRIK